MIKNISVIKYEELKEIFNMNKEKVSLQKRVKFLKEYMIKKLSNMSDKIIEELSTQEKLYLKKIVKTARNKYIEKIYQYINNTNIFVNDAVVGEEDSVLESVLERCQQEVNSAIEFERALSNPSLYNVVKVLSLKEKEVLFYLYKKQKNISEISRIMHLDRKTVRKLRDIAQAKIAENLINGEG